MNERTGQPGGVCVMVCTCARPMGLRSALQSLAAMDRAPDGSPLDVIVVDNDPDGTARQTCEAYAGSDALRIRYVAEPRRGLSFARNAALEAALEHHDMAAFIDDDERVGRGWLRTLLEVQHRCDADAVSGPVISEFEPGAPAWAGRVRVFTTRELATGTRLPHCFTNNVLMRLALIREHGLRFDEALAFTSAEDTMFFKRLHALGGVIVWAADAQVRETVPLGRTSVGWVLRRGRRIGSNMCTVNRTFMGWWRGTLWSVAIGAARLAHGLVLALPARLLGAHAMIDQLWFAAYGWGLLLGAAGWKDGAYRVTDGG